MVTQMQMIVWPDLGAPNEARLGACNIRPPGNSNQENIKETGGYGAESRAASGKYADHLCG